MERDGGREKEDDKKREGDERREREREREAATEPMTMRATDVKRVCRDRVEHTFHRLPHFIAFKLSHGTYRRSVGRTTLSPFAHLFLVARQRRQQRRRCRFSLFYTRIKRTNKRSNGRMHDARTPRMHALHTPDEGFPEERKRNEERRERERAHAAAPRRVAPLRKTERPTAPRPTVKLHRV